MLKSLLLWLISTALLLGSSAVLADDVSISAELTTSNGQKTMVSLNREQHLYDVGTTHDESALAFTVKNVSNHNVALREQRLPSFPCSGRLVLTASWKWGDPLPPMAPPPLDYDMPAPGDPIRAPTILKPGDSKVYLVPLSLRIDDLPEARKKGDVVVFWYFEAFDVAAGKRVGQAGGWFDMPKTGH